ncbi:putative ribonuclease H protein [Corchorus olitorius]|uniref:Ribonuclease H protein n=1 Tax=Corchorus olitorius TaxID=93759 RepID=A0A1R3GS88_9ROSI|nr:putative ribonuclease H protein [Corchorus olitorius]
MVLPRARIVGAGGVIRDSTGRWLVGYAAHLGDLKFVC